MYVGCLLGECLIYPHLQTGGKKTFVAYSLAPKLRLNLGSFYLLERQTALAIIHRV